MDVYSKLIHFKTCIYTYQMMCPHNEGFFLSGEKNQEGWHCWKVWHSLWLFTSQNGEKNGNFAACNVHLCLLRESKIWSYVFFIVMNRKSAIFRSEKYSNSLSSCSFQRHLGFRFFKSFSCIIIIITSRASKV